MSKFALYKAPDPSPQAAGRWTPFRIAIWALLLLTLALWAAGLVSQ